jgi:hypothetical protein
MDTKDTRTHLRNLFCCHAAIGTHGVNHRDTESRRPERTLQAPTRRSPPRSGGTASEARRKRKPRVLGLVFPPGFERRFVGPAWPARRATRGRVPSLVEKENAVFSRVISPITDGRRQATKEDTA